MYESLLPSPLNIKGNILITEQVHGWKPTSRCLCSWQIKCSPHNTDVEYEEQKKVLGKSFAKNAAVSNVLGITIISNGKEII